MYVHAPLFKGSSYDEINIEPEGVKIHTPDTTEYRHLGNCQGGR